jgi:ribose transport system substrate-binding protein
MSRPEEPNQPQQPEVHEDVREAREVVRENSGLSRRDLVKRVGLGTLMVAAGGGVLSQLTVESPSAVAAAACGPGGGKGLKMLGTNGGLNVSWYAQGKETMDRWASQMGVDLTWIDGQSDATKQRASLDNAAARQWDIAGITPASAGTIVPPVQKMIDNGVGVFQMTSNIGGPNDKLNFLTFVEQSSYDMGLQVSRALFDKAGGKGTVIQTRGVPGGSDQEGRDRGFKAALAQYPGMTLVTEDFGNWDRGKSQSLWESYLNRYPDVTVAYCQNDDMAFGALTAAQNAGRTNLIIGGADGMPDAVDAVRDGRMTATMRHSSCQIHSLPVILGVAWKLGAIKSFPSTVPVIGPLVTPENAEAVKFMQSSAVLYA